MGVDYFDLSENTFKHSFTSPETFVWFNYDASLIAGTKYTENGTKVFIKYVDNSDLSDIPGYYLSGFAGSPRKISHQGDRLFFTQWNPHPLNDSWYIVDHIAGAVREPKQIVIDDYEFHILDIANNGRRLLAEIWNPAVVDEWNIELAVFDEMNGQWVKHPHKIAEEIKAADIAKCIISENGKVIACQALNFADEAYNYYYYDVFVIVQNDSGEWITHKVNSADDLAKPSSILLTDDGTRLFWHPWRDSSVPFAEHYE